MEINPPVTSVPASKKKSKGQFVKLLLGMFIGLVCLGVFFITLDHFKVISLSNILPKNYQGLSNTSVSNTTVIAKVGAENIYQSDLDTEIFFGPKNPKVDMKKQLLAKIVKDSIILQEGKKNGLVQLDTTVFNSAQKDYMKRMSLLAKLKKQVEDERQTIAGSLVAIWFYNTEEGDVGYTKGKEIALQKMTQLHSDVVSNKITMKQASEQIKNDTSLIHIDKAYKVNAYLDFSRSTNQKITISSQFDSIIRGLQKGQVSNIYLAQDKQTQRGIPTGKMIDAVYMFAQVTDKKDGKSYATFEDWYAGIKNNYAVTYF